MDESTYRNAHQTTDAALRLLLDHARLSKHFEALHTVAERCHAIAYERCGQHTRDELLQSEAKAALESTMKKEPLQAVDVTALRKVTARLHLNTLATELQEARARLRADWPGMLLGMKQEGVDALTGSVVAHVSDILRVAGLIAGYAALHAFEGPDMEGAVDAQQRGELLEMERQVSRLAYALYVSSK